MKRYRFLMGAAALALPLALLSTTAGATTTAGTSGTAVVSSSGGVVGSGGGVVGGGGTPPPEATGVVSSGQISAQAAARAADFWTPARMAKAKPVEIGLRSRATAVPAGNDIEAAATGGLVVAPRPPKAGAEGTPLIDGESGLVEVTKPYTNLPDRTVGKVFFTKGGDAFVCSGTAVNAPNRSVVWTAGHCVEDGVTGGFHENWVFVPAYSSTHPGSMPFGTWTARELWTLAQWAYDGNWSYDVGAAVINRKNNRLLTNVTGGQGLKFSSPRNQHYSAFGYPQAPPFTGELQWRANSNLLANDDPPGDGPNTLRIANSMTGGSSGGPWFTDLGENGLGYVTSVNSYKYVAGPLADPNHMYGPYMKAAARALWDAVKNLPV